MASQQVIKSKRRRTVLSIETKLKIIERLEKGESVSKLACEYEIGGQTVRDLLRNKNKLMNYVSSSDTFGASSKRKTIKKSTFTDLDTALYEWFKQKCAEGTPISGPLLSQKAQWFHSELKITESFQASQGWLARFKSRHGIRQLEIQGEKLSGDLTAAELYRSEFKRIIQQHNLSIDQIYNADETGLFWKALPSKTLASHNERSAPGHKSSKERITLLACSNASGSHKVKLVCIGKSKKPRSFKGTEIRFFPVDYYSQSKAWMNQEIFKMWFFDKFIPSVHEFMHSKDLPEKAMLLLDNSPAHPNECHLKSDDGQIFVSYLPPNVTALIQPMDQGILETLKRHYRRRLLHALLEEETEMKAFWKKWSIKDAIFTSADSWDQIQPISFKRSWRKLYPSIIEEDDHMVSIPTVEEVDSAADCLQLIKNTNGFEEVDITDMEEWLNADNNEPGYEIKDDTTIAAEVLGILGATGTEEGVEIEDDSSDEELVSPNNVPLQQALNSAEILLTFLEQQEESNYSDIINVRKIRTSIRKKMNEKVRQHLITDYCVLLK